MSAASRAIALALVVAGCAGAYWWWQRPERQIRRTLDGIAGAVSHERPAAGLSAAAAAARLNDYLAPDVVVEPGQPLPPIAGRDALLAAAARAHATMPSLDVSFDDVSIVVEPDGTLARVTCTVTAAVRDGEGRDTLDAREITIELRRADGRWVVYRAAAVTVLERLT